MKKLGKARAGFGRAGRRPGIARKAREGPNEKDAAGAQGRAAPQKRRAAAADAGDQSPGAAGALDCRLETAPARPRARAALGRKAKAKRRGKRSKPGMAPQWKEALRRRERPLPSLFWAGFPPVGENPSRGAVRGAFRAGLPECRRGAGSKRGKPGQGQILPGSVRPEEKEGGRGGRFSACPHGLLLLLRCPQAAQLFWGMDYS